MGVRGTFLVLFTWLGINGYSPTSSVIAQKKNPLQVYREMLAPASLLERDNMMGWSSFWSRLLVR